MSPRLRKLALTAHVCCSVGWAGAVASFLTLAIAGVRGSAGQPLAAVYVAMNLVAWGVIVPLAFASLLTGVVSSLGSGWGLIRYHWVIMKLTVTVFSTLVLLVHMQPIALLAHAAERGSPVDPAVRDGQVLMVFASSAALLVLLLLTGLSVYKPRGMTAYGTQRSFSETETRGSRVGG